MADNPLLPHCKHGLAFASSSFADSGLNSICEALAEETVLGENNSLNTTADLSDDPVPTDLGPRFYCGECLKTCSLPFVFMLSHFIK